MADVYEIMAWLNEAQPEAEKLIRSSVEALILAHWHRTWEAPGICWFEFPAAVKRKLSTTAP